MRVRVSVRLREGVLDPEAKVISRSLTDLGFDGVRGVTRERVIELDLATDDEAEARSSAEAMCAKLLANPVIETYRIETRAAS